MTKRVAIIGTRQPDGFQRKLARLVAFSLTAAASPAIVITGGADGIDRAAMLGAADTDYLEVVLPWPRYNHELIPDRACRIVYSPSEHPAWTQSVHSFHPRPDILTRGGFALHARNYGIIEPAQFVLALPDATGGGGTGQGIRIAHALAKPIVQINRSVMKSDEELRTRHDEIVAQIAKLV